MSSTASVVDEPPVRGESSFSNRKALVVGADYFALTSRIDPNVIFWSRREVLIKAAIPDGVTHIWIAPDLRDEAQHILAEANGLSLCVWSVVVGELRRRLLPFWTRNRSVIDPVEVDGEPGAKLRNSVLAPSYSDDTSGSPTQTEFEAMQARLKLLRDAHERALVRRTSTGGVRVMKKTSVTRVEKSKVLQLVTGAKSEQMEVSKPPAKVIEQFDPQPRANKLDSERLRNLPSLERQVVSLAYGVDTGKVHSVEEIAEEFGLPVANVQRIIARVRTKIGIE